MIAFVCFSIIEHFIPAWPKSGQFSLCVGQIQPNVSKNLQVLNLPTGPQAYITNRAACRRGVKRLLSTNISLKYSGLSAGKKWICYCKIINEAAKRKQIKWIFEKTNKTNTGEQTKGIIWKQQQSNNSMHRSVAQQGACVYWTPLFKSQTAQDKLCWDWRSLYNTAKRTWCVHCPWNKTTLSFPAGDRLSLVAGGYLPSSFRNVGLQKGKSSKREGKIVFDVHLHCPCTRRADPAAPAAQSCIQPRFARAGRHACRRNRPWGRRHLWCSPDAPREKAGISPHWNSVGPRWSASAGGEKQRIEH